MTICERSSACLIVQGALGNFPKEIKSNTISFSGAHIHASGHLRHIEPVSNESDAFIIFFACSAPVNGLPLKPFPFNAVRRSSILFVTWTLAGLGILVAIPCFLVIVYSDTLRPVLTRCLTLL